MNIFSVKSEMDHVGFVWKLGDLTWNDPPVFIVFSDCTHENKYFQQNLYLALFVFSDCTHEYPFETVGFV